VQDEISDLDCDGCENAPLFQETKVEARYYECCQCGATETLYYTDGKLEKTPRWKEVGGKMYHRDSDDRWYEAREIRGEL